MSPLLLLADWAESMLRWLHVVAAITWLGSLFYFLVLERGLQRHGGGVAWQVHGGGFYRIEAFGTAPPVVAPELTRFRWPAYAAWLSGFGLLLASYLLQPSLRLVDPAVAPLAPALASGLALATLVVGYGLYEALCRSSLLARSDPALVAAVLLLLAAIGWLHAELFAGRAALLLDGAVAGTIMVANIAHIVFPGERRIIAALHAGERPDPAIPERLARRLRHNEILALPVLFAMLASHHPALHAGGIGALAWAAALLGSAALVTAWHRRTASAAAVDAALPSPQNEADEPRPSRPTSRRAPDPAG